MQRQGAATDLELLTGMNYSASVFSVAGNPPILVPEPSTFLLLIDRLKGVGLLRRRFKS